MRVMRVQSERGRISTKWFEAREQRLLGSCYIRTISMINRELSTPSRALGDAVIWAVLCLAHNLSDDAVVPLQNTPFTAPMSRLQWLEVYGSLRPSLVHVEGLIQMVNLRGGLDQIELPGLAAVISL